MVSQSLMIYKFQTLLKHKGFIKYFKNTSWLFAEKILRMIVGLFVGIWVARYLGPEQFGLFSYAQSLVALFTAIATLGLDGIVIREIVKDESRAGELLGTAFWLKLFGAVAVLGVLSIVIHFISNDCEANTLVLIIASATIFQAFNVIDFYFQAKVLSKYIAFANMFSLFLSSLVKIIFILYGASLIAFVWVILFDSVVLACGFIYFFTTYKKFNALHITFSKITAVALLRDSWPIIIASGAISVYVKIDQVMIQEMLGSYAVGQYAAAIRFSEVWYFIPIVVASSLFPSIVNAKKQSEELYNYRVQKLYDFIVWIAIAIAIPMTYLSEWIVNGLYGDQYNEAGNVLRIHIWSGVFVFLGVVSGTWLLTEGLQLFSTINTIVGAIINVLLNYILIPRVGIEGAAWATVVAYAFSGYILLIIHNKTRINFFMLSKSLFLVAIFQKKIKNEI